MVGVLIVTHGNLADALVVAAARLAGPLINVRSVSINQSDSPEQIAERIAWEAEQADRGAGLLFLVDLPGSTPANLCMAEASRHPDAQVLSGVNLPMLMELETATRTGSVLDLAAELRSGARRSIRIVGQREDDRA